MGFASTPKGCRTEVLWLFSRVLWTMSLRASEVQVQFIARITGSLQGTALEMLAVELFQTWPSSLGGLEAWSFQGFEFRVCNP